MKMTTDLPLTWDDNGVAKKYGIVNLQNEDDWELRADGWYYYKTALGENETTSSLLKSVILNCDANLVGGITMSDDGKSGESNPSDYAGAKFHVYVEFQMSAVEWDVDPCENGVLYDHIGCISNGPDTDIDFSAPVSYDTTLSQAESNGRGVNTFASTANDTYPVYYYRGGGNYVQYSFIPQLDNNAIWGDYCWKIIRTTDTGGVKMIYNGTYTESNGVKTCNANMLSSQIQLDTTHRFKYRADGGDDYQNSTAMQAVDQWFEQSNISTKEDMLEDTIFCNDINRGTRTNGSKEFYAAYDRNPVFIVDNTYNQYRPPVVFTPSVGCANKYFSYTKEESDKGNGKLNHKVAVMAGSVYKENYYASSRKETSYLDSDETQWTMTPLMRDTSRNYYYMYTWYHYLDTFAFGDVKGLTAGLRPVVSLKAGTKYDTSTTGAQNDPYIILED